MDSPTPQHSVGLPGGNWASTPADGISNGNVNAILSAEPSSMSDSESPSTPTSERLPMSSRHKLTLLSDHLLASLSAIRAPYAVCLTPGTFTQASLDASHFLSPDGFSWNKSQQSFPWMEEHAE